ncbi:MAG TPA: hypothetical protein VF407_03200 [Polyangiaceae bacterium]
MRERGPLTRLGFLLSAAVLAASSAGCGGSSSSSRCGTHGYTYVGGAVVVYGGAGWYDGSWGGGWYDPGDDGYDYGDYGYDDGTGYYDDGSYDDGSDNGGGYDDGSGYYDDGSGSGGGYDDGSGDYGSGDDGSGDYGSGDDGSGDYGSGDDGSGDDGSGDDGSGDDGTAAKKNLKLQSGGSSKVSSGTSHTQTQNARANSCYAYTCTMACTVGTETGREAKGVSASSQNDACTAAVHGLEAWAHHDLGQDVSACKQVADGESLGGETNDDGHTPASPTVNASTSTGSGTAHGLRRSPLTRR